MQGWFCSPRGLEPATQATNQPTTQEMLQNSAVFPALALAVPLGNAAEHSKEAEEKPAPPGLNNSQNECRAQLASKARVTLLN